MMMMDVSRWLNRLSLCYSPPCQVRLDTTPSRDFIHVNAK